MEVVQHLFLGAIESAGPALLSPHHVHRRLLHCLQCLLDCGQLGLLRRSDSAVVGILVNRKRKQWEINYRWGVMDQTEDKETMINKEFVGDDVIKLYELFNLF